MRPHKVERAKPDSIKTGFALEHFQAKHALGLDPRVDTGSPSENATTQREKSEARFYQNGIRSKNNDILREK
jgi:hypothetical protein